jgi:hypothetical protein
MVAGCKGRPLSPAIEGLGAWHHLLVGRGNSRLDRNRSRQRKGVIMATQDASGMPDWLLELITLAERYRETGIIYDLPCMTTDERYGALCYLRRYADGQA